MAILEEKTRQIAQAQEILEKGEMTNEEIERLSRTQKYLERVGNYRTYHYRGNIKRIFETVEDIVELYAIGYLDQENEARRLERFQTTSTALKGYLAVVKNGGRLPIEGVVEHLRSLHNYFSSYQR